MPCRVIGKAVHALPVCIDQFEAMHLLHANDVSNQANQFDDRHTLVR